MVLGGRQHCYLLLPTGNLQTCKYHFDNVLVSWLSHCYLTLYVNFSEKWSLPVSISAEHCGSREDPEVPGAQPLHAAPVYTGHPRARYLLWARIKQDLAISEHLYFRQTSPDSSSWSWHRRGQNNRWVKQYKFPAALLHWIARKFCFLVSVDNIVLIFIAFC